MKLWHARMLAGAVIDWTSQSGLRTITLPTGGKPTHPITPRFTHRGRPQTPYTPPPDDGEPPF